MKIKFRVWDKRNNRMIKPKNLQQLYLMCGRELEVNNE